MAEGLTDAAREALNGLLSFDPAVRRSRCAWLRDYAESPAPSNMIALLDRLDYVRNLGADAERTSPTSSSFSVILGRCGDSVGRSH